LGSLHWFLDKSCVSSRRKHWIYYISVCCDDLIFFLIHYQYLILTKGQIFRLFYGNKDHNLGDIYNCEILDDLQRYQILQLTKRMNLYKLAEKKNKTRSCAVSDRWKNLMNRRISQLLISKTRRIINNFWRYLIDYWLNLTNFFEIISMNFNEAEVKFWTKVVHSP
jgi:hypothetical protein